MIGPAFGGFLFDLIGSRHTFLLGAILVIIGFLLVWILVKEPQRLPQNTRKNSQ
jgi:predicted MFS family arabinose efflux permease